MNNISVVSHITVPESEIKLSPACRQAGIDPHTAEDVAILAKTLV